MIPAHGSRSPSFTFRKFFRTLANGLHPCQWRKCKSLAFTFIEETSLKALLAGNLPEDIVAYPQHQKKIKKNFIILGILGNALPERILFSARDVVRTVQVDNTARFSSTAVGWEASVIFVAN